MFKKLYLIEYSLYVYFALTASTFRHWLGPTYDCNIRCNVVSLFYDSSAVINTLWLTINHAKRHMKIPGFIGG